MKYQNFKKDLSSKESYDSIFFISIVVLIIISLASCGRRSQPSNNPISNENAQAILEARIKKTEEIRVQLDSLHEALRPIETVMTDALNVLNPRLTIDGKPQDYLQNFIARLREILKISIKGIIQYRADGSWVLERNIPLSLGRKNYSCHTSKIEITGQYIKDYEQLMVTFSDCLSPTPITIMSGSLYNNIFIISFYPQILTQLFTPNLNIGQCGIHLCKGDQAFTCGPILVKSDTLAIQLDFLEFIKSFSGTKAKLKVVVRDPSKKLIAGLELEAQSGKPTRIDLKTKE